MRAMRAASAVLFCLLLSVHIFAQTSNATLGGTVSDASGALIPGVSITATNTATGIVNTVTTNEAGAYQFPNLQTGTYNVTAGLPGFQTQTRNGIALGVSQQVRLNFTLQVGSVAQTVEVSVAADTLIATTSSSAGEVLPEYKLRDLPLGGRGVLDLLKTTGGVGPTEGNFGGFFAGGRLDTVNVTRDGFNVTDGRYNYGAVTSTYTSPDLIDEVRVIAAPVDAEYGRGAGQVQMVTRSGSNQFRGSLFWTNRNSALDASNWFNNFRGVRKDYENRNQFGGRFGGPIIKNKTFFFVLVDEQRYIIKEDFVGAVLTPLARQGIFRFFPGVDNQPATALNPTVDRNGNPVRPATATGDLQQFNVFTKPDGTPRDPFRPGFDATGFIQKTLLDRMPQPNFYDNCGPSLTGLNCDGLNTAGIRFTRRIDGFDLAGSNGNDTNRDQWNTRIDHNFNAKNKLSFTYTWERGRNMASQAFITEWPGGYNGLNAKDPRVLTLSLVSTLSPSIVNEFRLGRKTEYKYSRSPFYVGRPAGFTPEEEKVETGAESKDLFALLPKYNGIPLQVGTTLFTRNFFNWTAGQGDNRSANSPALTIGDNLSWTKGTHAFKAGGETRFSRSFSANDSGLTPIARLGPGGVAVQGIDNIAIPGLTGNNQNLARTLLTDLAGSVNSIEQGFDVRDPKNPVFKGYGDGVKFRLRDWRTKDFSMFFKDSWKVHQDLTLNLGVAYYYFGVPYDQLGRPGAAVRGERGLCGLACGSLTTVEYVGKNSPNPNRQLFNDDWNNVAPSVGLSWSLPWLGKDKTVLRAGYGISFHGNNLVNVVGGPEAYAGSLPGAFGGSGGAGFSYTQGPYLSLANLTLPIPLARRPLEPIALDGPRGDTMQGATQNRVSPYTQNFTLELQRELSRNLTLTVGYIGTKSTKLWHAMPLNVVEIYRNGFLDAFNTTRSGRDAALFDQMLMGLTIPGAGTVNGTTLTGSAALRAYTLTRGFIANGNVGQLADFLNRNTAITGKGGGFVRNGGLPETFFVRNPQFNQVRLHGNPSNSTYHSMQVQLTKRLSHGFTTQGTYTWSRALGATDSDNTLNDFINPRDPNNRAIDKSLLAYHRTHSFTANGTYELPFGPGRKFLANGPGWVERAIERWQFGAIFNRVSGRPLDITAPVSSVWQNLVGGPPAIPFNTPNIVGDFSKNIGKVVKAPDGVTYVPGLTAVPDPTTAAVTSLQGLNGALVNKAICPGANGVCTGPVVLVNPAPGQVGNLGLRWIEGPAFLGFDVNLIKRIRIGETKEFQLRVDTVNVLNHPNFGYSNDRLTQGNPTRIDLNIDSSTFGRITSATGSRRFTFEARVNF